MISISGVENKEAFFDSLIRFFAPIEIELTVWGSIPKRTITELTEYHIPCPWIRKWLFNEKRWQLSPKSIEKIRENICRDKILMGLTWGLMKESITLGFSRSWDDIDIEFTEFISEAELLSWITTLQSQKIIKSYKTVED
jgi:hypothetical protein